MTYVQTETCRSIQNGWRYAISMVFLKSYNDLITKVNTLCQWWLQNVTYARYGAMECARFHRSVNIEYWNKTKFIYHITIASKNLNSIVYRLYIICKLFSFVNLCFEVYVQMNGAWILLSSDLLTLATPFNTLTVPKASRLNKMLSKCFEYYQFKIDPKCFIF